jgi:vacuolar protein sorting-associated protein 18
MNLLEATDILKIEDILPLFPDFAMIDDFKEEICSALEDYSRHIESLRLGMEDATRNAESIKADIGELKGRFVTLSVSESCSHCQEGLFSRQFYVFPCYHGIHVDCLINLVGGLCNYPIQSYVTCR